MKLRPLCWSLALAFATSPMLAQAESQKSVVPSEKCRVAPNATREGNGQDNAARRPLSETLDDCNSVLKPPRTGDREITEPTPDIGKTPIIRPGELPAQQTQ